jgi:hypothetical protein
MTAVTTDAFRALNRYLGWGEPIGGVWFIGLEKALGWAGHHAGDRSNGRGW